MASKKKDFSSVRPADFFLTAPVPEAPEIAEEVVKEEKAPKVAHVEPAEAAVKKEKQTKPKGGGQKQKELRNRNFSVMATDSLVEDLKALAKIQDKTFNAMVNEVLGEEVARNREAIDQMKALSAKLKKNL